MPVAQLSQGFRTGASQKKWCRWHNCHIGRPQKTLNPKEHELVPDTVYPELHVGWHVDPLASELVQSPAPPFAGAADASHAFAEHVAAVSTPKEHELVPDIVYPELHVG